MKATKPFKYCEYRLKQLERAEKRLRASGWMRNLADLHSSLVSDSRFTLPLVKEYFRFKKYKL